MEEDKETCHMRNVEVQSLHEAKESSKVRSSPLISGSRSIENACGICIKSLLLKNPRTAVICIMLYSVPFPKQSTDVLNEHVTHRH